MIRRSLSSAISSSLPATALLLFPNMMASSSSGNLAAAKRLQSSSSSADYYSLLGVSPTASQDEIKKQYRTLAKEVHPDRPGGDEEKFKKISEAYSVLSNTEKKQQYDAMRNFGGGGGDGGGAGGRGFPGGYPSAGGGGGGGGPGGPFAQYQQTGRTTASWSPMPGGINDPYRSSRRGEGGGPFNFSSGMSDFGGNMSRQEADQIFRGIFGSGTLDEVFKQAQSSGAPTSSTTIRNPDGSFTEDSMYRTKDGRTVRISRTYEKGGGDSGGGGAGAGGPASSSSSYESFTQQTRAGAPGPGAAAGGGEQTNNPFSAAANPFNPGSFSSGPFGEDNPFFGAGQKRRPPGPGQSSSHPFMFGGNPFAAFGGSPGGGGGTGGAFSGGDGGGGGAQQQQQHTYTGHQQPGFKSPFQSSYWFAPQRSPLGGSRFGPTGFFYRYPWTRMFAVNLAIIFCLSALLSFSFTHPLFFLSMIFLFYISRGRM